MLNANMTPSQDPDCPETRGVLARFREFYSQSKGNAGREHREKDAFFDKTYVPRRP